MTPTGSPARPAAPAADRTPGAEPGPAAAADPQAAARAARQRWLALLAHADEAQLQALAAPWLAGRDFELLRAPEQGLALVRLRIGGDGAPFNAGELTLTRCVVRHTVALPPGAGAPVVRPGRSDDGPVDGPAAGTPGEGVLRLVGVGCVLGRRPQRALCIARLDALLQREDLAADLAQQLLAPLAAATAARQAAERAATEASRVHFYTLAPEAAA